MLRGFVCVTVLAGFLSHLPVSFAACADNVNKCTNNSIDANSTSDHKCSYLLAFNECLLKDPNCTNATSEVSSIKTNLGEPVCLGDSCTTNCTGINQMCNNSACTCSSGYGSQSGVCVLVLAMKIGDNCTASKCSVNMECMNTTCQCSAKFGDTGTGQCGTSCDDLAGYKGNVGNCIRKTAGDSCTKGKDTSCGDFQMCNDSGQCSCQTEYSVKAGTNGCVKDETNNGSPGGLLISFCLNGITLGLIMLLSRCA